MLSAVTIAAASSTSPQSDLSTKIALSTGGPPFLNATIALHEMLNTTE